MTIDRLLPIVVGIAAVVTVVAALIESINSPLLNWTAIGAGMTAIVGLLQFLVMRRQADIANRQAAISATQTSHMQTGLSIESDAANAAKGATKIAEDTLSTNREIERAYITLGHSDVTVQFKGPDGYGAYDETHPVWIAFDVDIVNVGRTPGDVLGGFIGYAIGDAPCLPDVTRTVRNLTPSFLTQGKKLDFRMTISGEPLKTLQLIMANDPNHALWLIGELDYRDRFGALHTSGYGRRFDPTQKTFLFAPAGGPFNFDSPMSVEKVRHYGLG